jgi:hypothetical protein
MFTPHRLHLQNGKETLTRIISVEPSRNGRFVVRVLNAREYPSNYIGVRPSGGGNFDTFSYDTEQQADDRAAKLLQETLDQGYLLV